jgi:signal transduction histidine kinase
LAALAGLLAYQLTTHDPNGAFPPVAVVLTFYMVGRSGEARRHPLRGVLIVGMALAACGVISTEMDSSVAEAITSWAGVAVVPLAAGLVVARQSGLSLRLAAVAAQLRAGQDLNANRVSAEERNRVARDLHDVVAHCVSVMVVQAGAARLVAESKPADSDEALAMIGACGRDALADLRRIVGVLRRNTDADFGCGAGLADLGRLAERIRLAGVPTHVSVDGDMRVPPAVDLVAYRVAQEALTNVVKHAGAGATAEVRVNVGPDDVTLHIVDVAGAGGHLVTSSGHGLVGMRERLTAHGGDLQAGPRPEGGYAVHARIPLQRAPLGGAGSGVASRRAQRTWRRLLPTWLGGALVVVGWLVAMETEAATSPDRRGPWAINAAAVAAMALAATWRRRSPLLFLVVVGGVAAALSGGLTSLDRSTVTGLYTLVVPLFTIAAWQTRTKATMGLALWMTGASIVAVVRHASAGGTAGALVMGLAVWTAGRAWRAQRRVTADLTETTTRLAIERDDRARLAVATERTRIARELHGPVAHGVVTMVVQAEAARNLLAHQPGGAEGTIRAIEETGRDALTQLRRILGVLRATDSPHDDRTMLPAAPPAPTSVAHPRESLTVAPEEVLT